MLKLNELCVMAYENAKKREAKDGKVSTNTRLMLKHTATEVVEAAESYSLFKQMKDITSNGTNYEGFVEPNTVCESYCNSKKHFSSELADIVCCCMIIAAKENIDMEYAITACMEKNYKRAIGKGDK